MPQDDTVASVDVVRDGPRDVCSIDIGRRADRVGQTFHTGAQPPDRKHQARRTVFLPRKTPRHVVVALSLPSGERSDREHFGQPRACSSPPGLPTAPRALRVRSRTARVWRELANAH